MSAPRMTSPSEAAAATPNSARRVKGSGEISQPSTEAPLFWARCRHIGSPITPSPTKPSVFLSLTASIPHSFVA